MPVGICCFFKAEKQQQQKFQPENATAANESTVRLWLRACLRACLHEGGGPQEGEVTCGGLPHLTYKRDQIKMTVFMDRRVTPPKRVTSPTWGSSPPCKQALRGGGVPQVGEVTSLGGVTCLSI